MSELGAMQAAQARGMGGLEPDVVEVEQMGDEVNPAVFHPRSIAKRLKLQSAAASASAAASEWGEYEPPQLMFPHDLEDEEYGHYITFHFMVDLTSEGASPMTAKVIGQAPGPGLAGPAGAAGPTIDVYMDSRAATAPGGGSIASGIGDKGIAKVVLRKMGIERPRIVRSTTSLSMFLPENIRTEYRHAYSDHSPGGILTTAFGSGAGGEDIDKILAANTDAFAGEAGMINKIFASVMATIKTGVGSTTAKAFGISTINASRDAFGGLGAYGSAIMRKTFNPRMEFLYKSTGPRTFSYSFKLIPKGQSESDTIRKIVKLFKVHSHPRIEDKFGNFIHFPNQFEIEYMSYGKENQYLNKISTCVLEGMNIEYNTENRVKFMRSTGPGQSPPMTTTLTLNFKELEILTATRAEQGY